MLLLLLLFLCVIFGYVVLVADPFSCCCLFVSFRPFVRPSFPSFFLLALQRIGNLSGGARDIKRHPYFANYDFQGLLHKSHTAPWIPPIQDNYDASNFRKRNDDFELHIDVDDGVKRNDWSDSF